jgi:transcriptional regulator with XRE-family HTH domain
MSQKMQKPLSEVIRELRAISKESQQFFGARLRISTRALQQYESGERRPEPKQLVAFAAYADSVGKDDFTEQFIEELERQLAPPPGYLSAVVFRRGKRGISATDVGLEATQSDLDLDTVRGIHGRKRK